MKSRLFINLILLAAICGLTLFIVERQKQQMDNVTRLASNNNPGTFTRIEIATLQHPKIVLQKIKGEWFVTSPVTANADNEPINRLLNIVRHPSLASYPINEVNLTELGLSPARQILRLDDLVFSFGKTDAIKNQRYVRKGEAVHLVDDFFSAILAQPTASFIDKKPFPIDATLEAIKTPYVEVSKSETGWQAIPEQKNATAKSFIDAWQEARAINVIPWQKPTEPANVMLIFSSPAGSIPLSIVREENKLLLVSSLLQAAYVFPADAEALLLGANAKAP